MPIQMESYVCELRKVGGSYFGKFPDLPGSDFISEAGGDVNAVAALKFSEWVEAVSAAGLKIPQPGAAAEMTGTTRIRVPKSIHRKLLSLCNDHNVSLSGLVTSLLYAGAYWMEQGLADIECGKLDDGPIEVNIGSARRFQYDIASASGAWTQKLPKDLHFHLTWLASREGVSLNLLCAILVTRTAFGNNIQKEHSSTVLRAVNS